jgi:glycosyltransferase involved in cell wall biosynthesis
MADPSNVTIIIPVGDDASGLALTLSTLQQIEGCAWHVEIVVCNDGGHEDVSRIARQYNCVEAILPTNQGSYAARNAGIAVASGSTLAFLDSDQRVDPNWLQEGLRGLDTADYVGGRIVVETISADDIWHLYDRTYAFPVNDYLCRKHFAPTANLFVRKHVIDVVGPFDARLRSGGDWEFGARVAAHGFRQAYRPEAVTFHASRGRSEQFKKLRRTASGIIDVRILVMGDRAVRLAALALLRMASAPLQVASQAFKWLVAREHRIQPAFSFAMIRKAHMAAFDFYSLRRSLAYIARSRSTRLGGRADHGH